jgi:hypothetical protein
MQLGQPLLPPSLPAKLLRHLLPLLQHQLPLSLLALSNAPLRRLLPPSHLLLLLPAHLEAPDFDLQLFAQPLLLLVLLLHSVTLALASQRLQLLPLPLPPLL